ncbi:MAG: hypothetical protein K8H89_00045 [Flavobacteriales bacterium]|nr:hypothetical protein [Flavobacteriales bacterium]
MRRILAPFSLLAITGLCAQPGISQLGYGPDVTIVVDAEFPITSAGDSGAHVTWDHGSAAFSTDLYTFTAEGIAKAPGADRFPNASAVFRLEAAKGVVEHDFFGYSGGFSEHGSLITGGGTVHAEVYSDPITYCAVPITFGDSGTDTYAYTTTESMSPSSTTGFMEWNVDAHGTLILPNATHADVLRVRSMSTETTTAVINGVTVVTEMQEESWRWFKSGCPLPLLTWSVLTDNTGSEPGATVAVVSCTGSTGLQDER